MKNLKNIIATTVTVIAVSVASFAGNTKDSLKHAADAKEISSCSTTEMQVIDEILAEVEIQIVDANLKVVSSKKFKSLKEVDMDKTLSDVIKNSELLLENNNTFIYLQNKAK